MKGFEDLKRDIVESWGWTKLVIEKKILHWTRITAFVGIVSVGALLWSLFHDPTTDDESIEKSSAEDKKVSAWLEVLDVSLSKTSLSIPASLEIELQNKSNRRTIEGSLLEIDLGRNRVKVCDWSAKFRGEWEETGSQNRVRIRLMTLEPRETFSLRCLISDAGFEKILLGGVNVQNRIEIQYSDIQTTSGGKLISRLETVLVVVSWILGIGISLGIVIGVWQIGNYLIERYLHKK